MNEGDFDRFLSLYAKDVVRFGPGMSPVEGLEAVREIEASSFADNDIEARSPTWVGYVAGDLATAWGLYVLEQTVKA